jgi:hypothetical protein
MYRITNHEGDELSSSKSITGISNALGQHLKSVKLAGVEKQSVYIVRWVEGGDSMVAVGNMDSDGSGRSVYTDTGDWADSKE